MQYMILIYDNEAAYANATEEEMSKVYEAYMAYSKSLVEAKAFVAAASLKPVATATTVRVRNGKTVTTDGPFAETKEQLGGFLMIDVPDLNDAIRVAAHFPAARFGSIEVRPLKELGCA
jgi:hypothetical protein